METKISIGILACDVEKYIVDVISEITTLQVPIYIIDDSSTDNTLSLLEDLNKKYKFQIIKNIKNKGAGESTKILLKKAKEDGYDFLIKVDGDGQFKLKDIEKIINLRKRTRYFLIKSNRFWSSGIDGNIPKNRFFGNIFATILLQIISGTNKLYDPLNGLFGVETNIIEYLNKFYPKRYGYPFYITAISAINNCSIYQINNTVIYNNQKSKLNPFKVLFTLFKLSIYFYFFKYNLKKIDGNLQRSVFIDTLFLINLSISFIIFITLLFKFFNIFLIYINIRTILFIFFLSALLTLILFISSYKEEKGVRNRYIENE